MEHEKASGQFRFLILLLLSIKVDWAEASQSNCESLLQFRRIERERVIGQ